MRETRFSVSPLRSIATMVLSKVAGSLLSAILRTSARCWRIPSSNAGR